MLLVLSMFILNKKLTFRTHYPSLGNIISDVSLNSVVHLLQKHVFLNKTNMNNIKKCLCNILTYESFNNFVKILDMH